MSCEWPNFSNVAVRIRDYTRGKTYELAELCEYEFMCDFLWSLRSQLGERFVQSKFLVYWKIDRRGFLDDVSEVQPIVDKRTVIFLLGDETASVPSELAARVGLIFKVHLQQAAVGNVFYFPLGCPNSRGCDTSVIDADSRTTSVFFSGALNKKRIGMYRGLIGCSPLLDYPLLACKKFLPDNLSWIVPGSRLLFTPSFGEGLNHAEYLKILHQSKIALCPDGFVNRETFRHYEAMRAGCVVVTKKMPPVPMFSGAPLVEIEEWSEVKQLLRDLLRNESLVADLQTQAANWWLQNGTPERVARYVAEHMQLA